jgi:WD40 repeat protein
MDLAVSSDGAQLATVGQDGQVALWNIADGLLQHRMLVGDNWVEHVAWSKSGKHLAVSSGRVVTILSSSGERIWSSENHPSTVSALGWVTDQELSTACYGRVTFFDISSAQESERLEWRGSLVSLALSPDGNIVACGSQDKSVHFWRRSSGQDSMMEGYASKPSALAFSQDGSLLASGGGEDITVWNFDSGGPEGTPGVLEFHKALVSSLAFSNQGRRLASGCREGGVVIWGLQKNGSGRALGGAPVNRSVEKVYWRPDGRSLAAIDADGGVTVWRVL